MSGSLTTYGTSWDVLTFPEWDELQLETTGSSGCRLYQALWYAWFYYVGWTRNDAQVREFVETREGRIRDPESPDGDRSYQVQATWDGIADFYPDPVGSESTRHREVSLLLAATMSAIGWYIEDPSTEQLTEIGAMVTEIGLLLQDTLAQTTGEDNARLPGDVEISEATGFGIWNANQRHLVGWPHPQPGQFFTAGALFLSWGEKISARARAIGKGLQVPEYMGPADLLCYTNVALDAQIKPQGGGFVLAGAAIAAAWFFTRRRNG